MPRSCWIINENAHSSSPGTQELTQQPPTISTEDAGASGLTDPSPSPRCTRGMQSTSLHPSMPEEHP